MADKKPSKNQKPSSTQDTKKPAEKSSLEKAQSKLPNLFGMKDIMRKRKEQLDQYKSGGKVKKGKSRGCK